MTDATNTPATRRKTEQAIKISASVTLGAGPADFASAHVFGDKSPLRIRGGRLTINAAIAIGDGKGDKVIRAYARADELERELAAIGTVHSFIRQPGAVPLGEAEQLPPIPVDDNPGTE
jgi:hypothetical protein